MRYAQGDLAILSAESYTAGVHIRPSRMAKKTSTDVATAEVEEVPARKRRKASSPEDAEDGDEKKSRRGRPRLAPKDETAQDRRRTQIRLAQRAYRHRKDSAIQSLERRVQELKETNEEMNKAFLRLHDFAVDRGLVDLVPEFGFQLRETTQKLLLLARRCTEDGLHDGDDGSVTRESEFQAEDKEAIRRKSKSPAIVERTSRDELQEPSNPPQQLYGGLVITHVPVTLPELVSSELSTAMTTPPTHVASPDYEGISYPTLDNATLPFGFSPDFSFTAPEPPVSTTEPDFSDLSSSLYPSLPLPNSYAAQEVTFGRRFQRTAIERAWRLVTMPNPPQKRINRVFGFCLLFEPLESIKVRLKRSLERTKLESLYNWQFPFSQLGGAGTHYGSAVTSSSPQRFGNQGTADVFRPKNANGFSMGPFDAKVNAARDLLALDANDYFPHWSPGFAAEYYDCDEIEIYLHQRGVSIPPGADFVAVEIDENAFVDEEASSGSAVEDSTVGNKPWLGAGMAPVSSNMVRPGDALSRHSPAASGSSDLGHGQSSGTLSPCASSGAETSITVPGGHSHTDPWRFDRPEEFGGTGKKQLTLDVNLFILEMVERATCLGRTPGLRREDINGAFRVATKHNL